METATIAGTWKSVNPSPSLPPCEAISRILSTIKINDTDIMMNENTIFPTVAIRAFPCMVSDTRRTQENTGNVERLKGEGAQGRGGTAGYFDSSIFLAARWESHSVILLNGSKIESAMVAKREYDNDDVAP